MGDKTSKMFFSNSLILFHQVRVSIKKKVQLLPPAGLGDLLRHGSAALWGSGPAPSYGNFMGIASGKRLPFAIEAMAIESSNWFTH